MATRVRGVCDRCGFDVGHRKLRKEWTGLLTCGPCYDPKPTDLDTPRLRPEGVPIPNARPEPEPVFRAEGELGGDDL